MSGGLTTRPFKKQEEDEDITPPSNANMPELRQLAQRLADRTPKGAPTPPPPAPSKDALGGYLKGASQGQQGDVSPEDIEIVNMPNESAKLRNKKTGDVYEPHRFVGTPGFEQHLNDIMQINQERFQKGVKGK